MPIKHTVGYKMIKEYYGDKVAKRSQMPLINHIDQGLAILNELNCDWEVMEAYAVHPIFQNDEDLLNNQWKSHYLTGEVMMLTMEYRRVANSFLSDKIIKTDGGIWSTFSAACELYLSPLQRVNEMLIADKVQNRKDFLVYHKGTHEKSLELDFYFKYWLDKLGISEERYQELVENL